MMEKGLMSKSNPTTSNHFDPETTLPPSRVKATDISPLTELTLQTLWTKGKIRVRCVTITTETHDVKTFHLISEPAQLFFFKPGQFIRLELNLEGKKVLRSYTISSSPSRPYTLAITVKRVEGGLVSNWLHDNLKPGDEIVINGPYGKFNCFDVPSPKMLFISAGSGITPMMSMVRWLCDTHSNCDMTFVYSARTPSDIIFRRELELLEVQRENFTAAITCTRTGSDSHVWTGFKGRLNNLMLQLMAPDYLERVVYVCGPTSFMENVREILIGLNFPMENYNEESFGDKNSKKTKPGKILPCLL